ncbi:MAG: hypothetical protein EAZ90_25815 [Oscillatoriales cyanobacterium]|nr:MAG: hypothetical protein EAZ94_15975 [Oscillatoriales cyanobacterium]TAE23197.1 MAG: hypothetical protein EAZ93_16095 [Oscillatoriales cyanobacterium]TAE37908.1 MAG: hypothetical protein EAZ90_25815 [Oscillatoriales cyanobacterium]
MWNWLIEHSTVFDAARSRLVPGLGNCDRLLRVDSIDFRFSIFDFRGYPTDKFRGREDFRFAI